MEYLVETTAKPEEVFSLAQFFLRWKYDTAKRIAEKFYIPFDRPKEEKPLRIFKLINIYYQDVPLESDSYKGFFLKFEPLEFLTGYSYEDMIPLFSYLFVLKSEVLQAERTSREFAALPAGDRAKLHNKICTPENLHKRGPQVFAELFTWNEKNKPSATEFKIPKDFVWPWLGPILSAPLENKELKGQKKENTPEYLAEVSGYIKMARDLGQEKSYCLAKMVRHRYPETTNRELVNLVEPENYRSDNATDQQVHRWLKRTIS